MISHHCSVCGEQVDEFCDAHPTATVDSILVSAENAAMIAYWYAKPSLGCACGCGRLTRRRIQMLEYEHRGTAETLGSARGMGVWVYVILGHESSVPDMLSPAEMRAAGLDGTL